MQASPISHLEYVESLNKITKILKQVKNLNIKIAVPVYP